MSFIPGEDAEGLRSVVREFLEKTSGEAEVRRLMETATGHDDAVWKQAAAIGLQGLAIAERHGGSGATPVELGVVFEEMGRALFPGPFFATVALAATALQEIDDDQYLPGIAAGDTLATLAWAGPSPEVSMLRAEPAGQVTPWAITGTAGIVVDGASADLLVVAARTPPGTGMFAVVGDAAGLDRVPLVSLDETRKLAELRFDATPARLLATDATAALRRASDLAALFLAAEQLGGAQKVLDTAVDYAGTRVQFGRAIGSFQAIKHRCADLLIEAESARSTVYHGLWAAVNDPAGLPVSAALARAVTCDAYQRIAAENIQIHGGIGFTWEHSAHLYFKRARSSRLLLGSPAAARSRLAELVAVTDAAPTSDVTESEGDEETASIDDAVARFLHEHPVPDPADREADRQFRQARFDAGLAVIHFSEGHGGRGLDPAAQARVEDLFVHAGAADHIERNIIGLGMAMPTIHAHGTEHQKGRYLRPCFSGAEIWCQLFSEPGAGSDLAALATRAVRDGEDFVVNGQKVWTSLGHVANFGLLLARTDPDVPKHRGLTYFVLDMSTPGVEVRPLRQLTGEAEFNEVYLTDVRVPALNVLGEVGQGWQVAMTTLANERVTLGRRRIERGEGPIGQAVELYREAAAQGWVDAAVTERLMLLWVRAEAARLTNVRAAAQSGRAPGPEGSIAKLQMAELNKAIYELCVDLCGEAGLLIDGYTERATEGTAVHGGKDVRKAYLRSLANSIEGGTSEVMRTILGERVLGLPPEPRVDRDIPWKDVPRK